MFAQILISWALGYGLSKGADKTFGELYQLLSGDELSNEIRNEAEEWASQLPGNVGDNLEARSVLGQMLQTERDPGEYGEAQERLAATLKQPAVPSTDEWFDALVERWEEVRHTLNVAEAHPFYKQDPEDAEEQLRNLAERLSAVCEHSPEHFRNTISTALQELEKKVDQLFDTPWATPVEYFSKWTTDGSLFKHTWSLVGREEVLDELEQFVLEADKQITILPGRGGIGKSKVLKTLSDELLKTEEVPEIRFVKEASEVKEMHIDSLPDEEPVVIILDDAHRRDDTELLALLQIVQQRNGEGAATKLILSTRPYRSDTIVSTVLRNGFGSNHVKRFDPLESLTPDQMRELARQALGPGYEGYADQLAAVGEDSPLVITVGGQLVRRDQINPRLLTEESDEFRSIVLERLKDIFSRHISNRIEPQETEGVLQLVAALSPVRPEDNEFVEQAASFLEMTPSRVRTVLNELEDAGAFVRRGGLVRIAPDVLSDDILHKACRTREGTTTPFAGRVFDHFADRAAEQILQNLAELDWRIRQSEGESDLLDEIWQSIREAYHKGDVHERGRLLDQLKETAYYLPRRMLQLVEYSLSHPAEVDAISAVTRRLDDHLAKILQRVAYTVDLVPRCLELLWGLADVGGEQPEVISNAAFDELKRLAKYQLRKPVSVQAEVLDAVETWIDGERVYGSISGPRFLDIVDQLLAKVVDSWRDEGHVARGMAYVVPMSDRDRELRFRAINAVTRYGASEHAGLRDALDSKASLVKVLRAPEPLLGLEISEEDHQKFESEQLYALDAIERLQTQWEHPVLDIEIIRSLRWHAQNATSAQVREGVAEIARGIDPTFEMRLTQSLMYSIDRRNPREDEIPSGYENHSEDPDALRRRTAQEFIAENPDPKSGFEELSRRISRLKDANPDGSVFRHSRPADPRRFLRLLAAEDPVYAAGLAHNTIANPDGPLDAYVGLFIQEAKRDEEIDALQLATDALANGGHQSYSIAGHSEGWHEEAKEQGVEIWRQILQHEDKRTRWKAINSLVYGDQSPQEKKSLALSAHLDEDPELADDFFVLFDANHGIGLDKVSDDDLRVLIQKLEPVGQLDKHWILSFLKAASERAPEAVFSLLVSRLQREATEDYRKYQAVPGALLEEHTGFGELLEGITEANNYRDMLRRVRDLMLEEGRAYSVPAVFVAISNGINQTARDVLREWVEAEDPERLRAILELIENGPETFVLENDDFVARILETAHEMGEEHSKTAKSRLLCAPRSGARTRVPHQPAAEDIRNRDKGLELAEEHSVRPLVQGFYQELATIAKEKIERDLQGDEELEM